MFDIAFSELLVIGIVALVVIGPERLPKVARAAGTWLGRLNRYVAQVKQDIDRDMQLEELRKLQQQMKDTAQKYEIIAAETGQELKREVEQVDRVMQAMAVTDGGLARQEYEKIKEEKAAAGELAGEPVAPVAALPEAAPTTTESVPSSVQTIPDEAATTFRSHLDDDVPADDMSTANRDESKPAPIQGT